MVFRRNYKRSYRRRRFNRNKLARKRMVLYSKRIPKVLGYPKQKVYYFKRTCELNPVLAGADGADVIGAYTFQLNDLPNYTDFTNLYDSYKINKVVVRFFPAATLSDTTTFSNFSTMSMLRIFTAVDYFYGSNPTTINQIREYQNCKITQYTRGHNRGFTPKTMGETEGEVAGSSTPALQYSQLGNPWVSADYPDVVHYSLVIGVNTSSFNTANITPDNILLRAEATYYFACKNPR